MITKVTWQDSKKVNLLARITVFCCSARHLTLTLPLFTSSHAYKWVPENSHGVVTEMLLLWGGGGGGGRGDPQWTTCATITWLHALEFGDEQWLIATAVSAAKMQSA